jgi:hypothetical protein
MGKDMKKLSLLFLLLIFIIPFVTSLTILRPNSNLINSSCSSSTSYFNLKSPWLYNNSIYMFFNETKFNNTIFNQTYINTHFMANNIYASAMDMYVSRNRKVNFSDIKITGNLNNTNTIFTKNIISTNYSMGNDWKIIRKNNIICMGGGC